MHAKNSPDRASLGASLSLGLLSLAPLPAQSAGQRERPQDPPAVTAPTAVQPLQFPKDPFVERLQQSIERRNSAPETQIQQPQASVPAPAPEQVNRDFSGLRLHHSSFMKEMRAEQEARQGRSEGRIRDARSRPGFDENLDQEVNAAMRAAEGARNSAATTDAAKSNGPSGGNTSAQKQRAPANDQDPALQGPVHHDFSDEPMIITPTEPAAPSSTPPNSAARTEHFWKQPERAEGTHADTAPENDQNQSLLTRLGRSLFPSADAAEVAKDGPIEQLKKLRKIFKFGEHFVGRPIGMVKAVGKDCGALLDGLDYLDPNGPAFYRGDHIPSTGYPELDVVVKKANGGRDLLQQPVPLRLTEVRAYIDELRSMDRDLAEIRDRQLEQFKLNSGKYSNDAAKSTLSSAGYCEVAVAEQRAQGGASAIASLLRAQANRVEAAAISNTLLKAAQNVGNKSADPNPVIFSPEESADLGEMSGITGNKMISPK